MKVAVVPLRLTAPEIVPAVLLTMNVELVMVVASMAVLNVAEIEVVTGTPVLLAAGNVKITCGAEPGWTLVPVEKLQEKSLARDFPVAVFAPVVMVAV